MKITEVNKAFSEVRFGSLKLGDHFLDDDGDLCVKMAPVAIHPNTLCYSPFGNPGPTTCVFLSGDRVNPVKVTEIKYEKL